MTKYDNLAWHGVWLKIKKFCQTELYDIAIVVWSCNNEV